MINGHCMMSMVINHWITPICAPQEPVEEEAPPVTTEEAPEEQEAESAVNIGGSGW